MGLDMDEIFDFPTGCQFKAESARRLYGQSAQLVRRWERSVVRASLTVFRRGRSLESVVDAGCAWSHTGWLHWRTRVAPDRRFSELLCCQAGLREVVVWIPHSVKRGLDSGRDAG